MKYTRTLTALVYKEEGVYVVECPDVGTASQGDTVDEAVANLKEATGLYLEEAPLLHSPHGLHSLHGTSSDAASPLVEMGNPAAPGVPCDLAVSDAPCDLPDPANLAEPTDPTDPRKPFVITFEVGGRLRSDAHAVAMAVALYREGRLSLGKAAELAGARNKWEMIRLLNENGVSLDYDAEDADADLRTLRSYLVRKE